MAQPQPAPSKPNYHCHLTSDHSTAIKKSETIRSLISHQTSLGEKKSKYVQFKQRLHILERLIERNRKADKTLITALIPFNSGDRDTPSSVTRGVSRCQSSDIAEPGLLKARARKRKSAASKAGRCELTTTDANTQKFGLPCLFYYPNRSKYTINYLDGGENSKPRMIPESSDPKSESVPTDQAVRELPHRNKLKVESSSLPLVYQDYEIIRYLLNIQLSRM